MEANLVQDIFYERLLNTTLEQLPKLLEEGFVVDLGLLKEKKDSQITINKNNCYLSLHSEVWNNINLAQKMASIIFLDELFANNQDRQIINFTLTSQEEKPLFEKDYNPSKDELNCYVSIRKLNNSLTTSLDVGMDLMELGEVLKIEKAIKQLHKNGETPKNYTQLEIVNYMHPIKRPQSYNKFINDINQSSEELQEMAQYINQPIKQKMKQNNAILFELVYLAANDLDLEDSENTYYLFEMDKKWKVAKEIFSSVENKSEIEFYTDYYNRHLSKLNSIIKSIKEKLQEEEVNEI